MLYIFDKDGSLIKETQDRPANTPEEQILLPNVREKIDGLRKQGNFITIASNQGGVSWGFLTRKQASDLMYDCSEKIGGTDDWIFCPHDDKNGDVCECRKPKGGMLAYLMHSVGVDETATIMVGDRETDKQAAESVGCRFEWASDFFGWSK
jgi:histidinol-phosphate phosphatase family protein